MRWLGRYGSVWAAILVAFPVFAGFPSTETFLPAVGRVTGQGGAQFYTTVWATNLGGAPVSITFDFLKQGQANSTPASFGDTLQPGETKVYENVIETKFGIASAIGAARIVADGEILVSERIYDQPPGTDVGNTQGLFFAGVPKTFSISAGQSASIQGIDQGGAENFRYNFALVETGGGSPTVNVQLFDGSGTLLGQKAYVLQPYEQIQPNVTDITAAVHTTNARITATVTGGSGSVLIAGAQLANESQDSSGFEMSFRDQLLGGGGTAGVTSLNGLTGALTIAHGANTTVNVSGNKITIDAVSGSGTGLTAVAHDNSLAGSGTVSVPLAIANGQVVRSLTAGGATLHDAVTLAAGSNVTLTPSGSTITIAATGGSGGGLSSVTTDTTLKGNGTGGLPLGVNTPLALSGGSGDTISGAYTSSGGSNAGVFGSSASTTGFGVHGHNTSSGNDGYLGGPDYGVFGISGGSASGVVGKQANGNLGELGTPSYAVYGKGSGNAVYGETSGGTAAGVQGHSSASNTDGYLGGSGYGVFGTSALFPGVLGTTGGSSGGVRGQSTLTSGWGVVGKNTADNNSTGYLGGNAVGVEGDNSGAGGSGVFGYDTGTGDSAGVYGVSTNSAGTGVWGSAPNGWGMMADGGIGIHASTSNLYAGIFQGDVAVIGELSKTSGSFKIDHPLDPANKYLYHSFVESPDMMNIYNGLVTLDASGVATIVLPNWFGALNRDFRYQLTPLGTPQPALFVAQEVENNQFKIAGGVPGARVSWQVTGIRQDAWANAHRIPVEQDKPDDEQGTYLHPELFGEPRTKSFDPLVRERASAESGSERNER